MALGRSAAVLETMLRNLRLDALALIAQTLRLTFGVDERCVLSGSRGIRHLRGGDRQLHGKIQERICQITAALAEHFHG